MFDWVVSTIESWGYLGVLALMVAENVFPPIPSEVIMPLAGFLAGSGRMSLTLTIVVGTLGSVLGTLMWYYIGLWFGEERLKRFAARHGRLLTLSPSDIDAAHGWFLRHGAMAVFFGRMIPAIRTLISVPAGLARMPMWKFLLYTTAGSALWTGILTFAGLMLHENYALVADWVDPLSKLVVVVVVAVYVWRVIRWKPH
ncbi:membrane protein DedA, SNARE-associated domain [Paracoccus aminovorans]|uniref:Membrane protein DedA, SNARE-associated domain n=1 Tax=Paracoccus aminovorans TaxID=34004 RepID=A0A1I3EFQ9_9RHOB|nr:DedA family protein [Paracoccus aminovorans]CQR86005.1 DedA family protein [Paracoccus aminovorans]SFH97754.1 membrane protein DedA, SNARE-associated domain [Paracoccus aminovorans]